MFVTVSLLRVAHLAVTISVVSATSISLTDQQSWACSAPPVEPCVKRHGRLSSQNGIPLRLWLIGTTRMVAADNEIDALPPEVRKYLEMTSEDHSYIFGDFVLCPLEPDTPGRLRHVCVTGAERLVVQPLNRPAQSFRIVSTWPRIGTADTERYRLIRDAKEWANPFLVIGPDGINLRAKGLPENGTTVSRSDLDRSLLELPAAAWPYGRVVALQEASIRRPDKSDEGPTADNLAAALATLKRLDVVVEKWPH